MHQPTIKLIVENVSEPTLVLEISNNSIAQIPISDSYKGGNIETFKQFSATLTKHDIPLHHVLPSMNQSKDRMIYCRKFLELALKYGHLMEDQLNQY